MKFNMLRRTKIRLNQTRLSFCPSSVVAALVSFFAVALSLHAASLSTLGSESSRVETIQTIETPLGGVRVGRAVSPEYAKTFEPFDLTVDFQKPKGVKIAEDDLAGSYGDFNVELLGDETRDVDENHNIVSRRWRLYPKRRGELTLPPIPISLSFIRSRDSSEPQTVVALLPEQKFVVPESDAPLKSADEVVVNLNPIRQIPKLAILIAGVVVAILILVASLFASKNRDAVDKIESLTETPYEKARRKLNELKNAQIYLENDRRFYDEIDDILREYVASVFPLKAQEMTTQEILRRLDAQTTPHADMESNDAEPNRDEKSKDSFDIEKALVAIETLKEPDIRSQLETTLTALDLIKFAKHSTTFNNASDIYANVCDFVERSFSSYVLRLDELRRQLTDQTTSSNAKRETSP